MEIIANSYFCGAGLFDSGLIESGIKIGQAFELNTAACKTYRFNLGSHIKQSDLTQELVLEQDSCHVMAFTYPCNHYSEVADLFGTRTGDELFLHALRHLAIAKPPMFIVENVPGMKKFPVVMEAMSKLPDYYCHVFCPVDAHSDFGLPQKRPRLIIVGTQKPFDIRPPEGHKQIPLSAVLEKEPEISWTESIATRMTGGYRDKPIISDPAKGDIAPLCVAHYSKDRSTRLVADKRFRMGVRPYTVREYARLQGLSDDFLFPVSNSEAFKQIGNGVPKPLGIYLGNLAKKYFNKSKVL